MPPFAARVSTGLGVVEALHPAASMENVPMPTPKTLSVAQLLVLNTAADRPDQMVLPLPAQIHARGAAMRRLLTSLVKASLAEEVPTFVEALSWRRDDAGQHHALRITALGRAAIGQEPAMLAPAPVEFATEVPSSHEIGELESSSAAAASVAATSAETTPGTGPAVAATNPDRPAGKLGQVLAAAASEAGATLDELVVLTGWQPHTARAALCRLRQRGFDLRLTTVGDRKAYRPWTGA